MIKPILIITFELVAGSHGDLPNVTVPTAWNLEREGSRDAVPLYGTVSNSSGEAASEGLGRGAKIRASREYEASVPTASDTKNKLTLAIINMLIIPGFCGVDRCCMGSLCLGFVKACTLGGCGIWFLADYFVILYNCLMKEPSLDLFQLGHNTPVIFEQGTIENAFIVTVVMICVKIGLCLCLDRNWLSEQVADWREKLGARGRTKVVEEAYVPLAA